MRIGYLECFSGISGDMLLGALVDAGVPFTLLEETAAALNVGAHLHPHKVTRGGISATKVDVITPHTHEPLGAPSFAVSSRRVGDLETQPESAPHDHSHTHEPLGAPSFAVSPRRVGDHEPQPESTHTHAPHRHLSKILEIIQAAPLSESVKARSARAFQLLGEAEAAIHSIPIERVHFHEVGAVDTIIDIVCSAAGAEFLAIDCWLASPLNVGSGTIDCQHGTLPVPAPATLALLADAPIYTAGPPMERVTPTGAAVLRMLDVSYATFPPMRVQSTGYGAGGRETPGQPNVLRLLIGEATQAAEQSSIESIAIIETVIDDSSPQLLAYVSDLLLQAGAWDVYRIAVQMKKGRTGVQITVLCRPDLVSPLQEILFRETTTIGLHWRVENKLSLEREFQKVQTEWGEVTIKIARWPSGKIANASPEYEDCRRVATEHKIPLKEVMQRAMRTYAEGVSEFAATAEKAGL